MKRILPLLLILLLLPAAAFAYEASVPVDSAMMDLTEVYGYLPEELKDFTFTVTETDTQWQVDFYPNAHPNWVYTTVVSKKTGRFISGSGSTPFHVEGYSAYPGEGGIRHTLYTAQEKNWFADLSAVNRAAFLGWLRKWNMPVNDALQQGLTDGNITTAQVINEYFQSCYGDPESWPQALLEWRDEVLASYGFTVADAPPIAINVVPQPEARYEPGIRRRDAETRNIRRQITVTEFAGEVPDELQQVLSHPMLAGWTCICGAYIDANPSDTPDEYETGLLALQQDGERMLVCLRRPTRAETWTVTPVGQNNALLSNGDVYITYAAKEGLYEITYPLSDTEAQRFRVRVIRYADTGVLCALEDYRSGNTVTGESIIIAAAESRDVAAHDGKWYHVTATDTNGRTTEEQISALVPPYLDFIDADAFPKTAEACRADAGYTLPQNYGVACGVHLRAKKTSHSKDLGLYHFGTLLEVLGKEPGNPFPWYHVRIGSVEGYMASLYVDYPGSDCSMKPLQKYPPLAVAKAVKEIQLKKGTGLFDGTVTTLPAGTQMHVLAEIGGWLHVMVPQEGDPGWLMDINGTDGYVKAKDVVTAATSQQLVWMQ